MSAHGSTISTRPMNLIFMATFILGFVTGGIVFLKNNTGEEGDGGLDTNTKGFVVLAHAYGGCSRGGCPSYRISDDGAYTYIVRSQADGEVKYEDELTNKQRDALRTRVEETEYESAYDVAFSGTCPIVHDGIAYTYDIEYKGERYEYDTCADDVSKIPLFNTLEDFFGVFNIVHRI